MSSPPGEFHVNSGGCSGVVVGVAMGQFAATDLRAEGVRACQVASSRV